MLDQYLVATDWLYSQALGGVKLESEALRSAPEASLPPTPDEFCPRCGAAVAGPAPLSVRSRALSLLVNIPFVSWRRSERRSACGHRWASRRW